MNLDKFDLAKPRPLPVFILADTSGSMKGEKIEGLNAALREMVAALREQTDIRGEIHLALITFGGAIKVLQPLTPITEVILPELRANGNTPMGGAFFLLKQILEDNNQLPVRAYAPTLILVSDGEPTDTPPELKDETNTVEKFLEWEPLKALHTSTIGKKSIKLAVGIGRDEVNFEILKAFVNNPDTPVIRAEDARGITKFFHWATMTIFSRSVSRNPDHTALPPWDDFKIEDLVI